MPTVITGTDGINQVQAGAVESGDLPAGSVIQVVHVEYDPGVEGQTTSTSFIDTGLQAAITPTSISNKILILAYDNLRTFDESVSMEADYGLFKNTTELVTFLFGKVDGGDSGTPTFSIPASILYVDAPNTTSEITYKTQIKVRDATFFANWNRDGNKSTITLMEIAG